MNWKQRQFSFSLADKDRPGPIGLVFDIQRFAVHDGGGIRTLVFLKGCPLRCKWCQNPESMSPHPDIMRIPHHCIGCVKCMSACPEQAIVMDEDGRVVIRRDACSFCGKCVATCYAGSMSIVGRYLSVDETLVEVERDRQFYENSGGGVTFSGGEPSMQREFLIAALAEAKRRGLHTAIETCAHGPWETFEAVLAQTDLVLTDIKHMDAGAHKSLTGVSNALIADNLRRMAALGARMRIRLPLIPGCNDTRENIAATAAFVAGLETLGAHVEGFDILPYHRLGEPKWEQLGRQYPMPGVRPPARDHVLELASIARGYVAAVTVGG
ncbi:MAG: glycyl-radical enzyme activating protein [Desulfovibrio sp.]|jgi:pyruvate formate lyase activating enzyme|nr:glycyl-radical enzyme activating protein [Desulfovibrio sp.]